MFGVDIFNIDIFDMDMKTRIYLSVLVAVITFVVCYTKTDDKK